MKTFFSFFFPRHLEDSFGYQKHSLKLFFWVRKIQFWSHRQKVFANSWRFLDVHKRGKKQVFHRNMFRQIFHGHVQFSYKNPAQKFLAESRQFFPKILKALEKRFPLKKFLPQEVPLAAKREAVTTSTKIQNFFTDSPKRLKGTFIKEKFCLKSSRLFFANSKASPENGRMKGRTLFAQCARIKKKQGNFSARCSSGYLERNSENFN